MACRAAILEARGDWSYYKSCLSLTGWSGEGSDLRELRDQIRRCERRQSSAEATDRGALRLGDENGLGKFHGIKKHSAGIV